MILGDGKRAYEQGEFRNISFEPVPKYGDYTRLHLVLTGGEYVTYTVMTDGNAMRLTVNGLNSHDTELIVEVDGNSYPVKNGQNSLVIEDLQQKRISVRLLCQSGEVCFQEVEFQPVE